MLTFANKLYRDVNFILQQDLALAHTANCTQKWFNEHGAPVSD